MNKFKKPERKSSTMTISELVQDAMRENGIEDKYEAVQIVAAWPKLMGEPINKKTITLFVKEKKLYAKIDSAPLKHQLYLGKDQIVKIYCDHFKKQVITDVVFL